MNIHQRNEYMYTVALFKVLVYYNNIYFYSDSSSLQNMLGFFHDYFPQVS